MFTDRAVLVFWICFLVCGLAGCGGDAGVDGAARDGAVSDPLAEPTARVDRPPGLLGFRLVRRTVSGDLLVASLVPGGAAEAAGLEAKDQILAVDGEPVVLESDLEAVRLFESVYAGDDVILTVLRDGQELDVEIVAAPMPAELAQRMAEERPAAVEAIRRQEARQWLETRAAEGPFVLVVERRDSGELSVRIDGEAEEVPAALIGVFRDTPLGARFDELIRAGDALRLQIAADAEGHVSFEELESNRSSSNMSRPGGVT